MPRHGADAKKVKKIKKILKRSGKDGIWMRELSRQTKIPFTTVWYYLNNFMKSEVIIKSLEFAGRKNKKIKIVKLKR